MDKQPVLSICIPTNGNVEWMIPVVESIYAQEVDNNLFEVVITDNGSKDDLERALQTYCYPNLRYFKTIAQGFSNQIDAFEKCSGLFCKMLNHRSKMMPGSIEKLVALVDRYKGEKPILYCAEGKAEGGDVIECNSTNEFVRRLSFWISWSAGTGAWKEDLIDIGDRALGNYSFRLDMIDGNVTNNISGNAVARDLYHVLSSSKDFVSIAKGKHIVFRLSKAFSLDIIVNNE